MSLSELIGFYSNCSCILENESLEVPVVPPRVGILLYIILYFIILSIHDTYMYTPNIIMTHVKCTLMF